MDLSLENATSAHSSLVRAMWVRENQCCHHFSQREKLRHRKCFNGYMIGIGRYGRYYGRSEARVSS